MKYITVVERMGNIEESRNCLLCFNPEIILYSDCVLYIVIF